MFELLTRLLVDMRRAVHRVDGTLRGQRDRTRHDSTGLTYRTDDLFCRLVDQIMIVRLQLDANCLSCHSANAPVSFGSKQRGDDEYSQTILIFSASQWKQIDETSVSRTPSLFYSLNFVMPAYDMRLASFRITEPNRWSLKADEEVGFPTQGFKQQPGFETLFSFLVRCDSSAFPAGVPSARVGRGVRRVSLEPFQAVSSQRACKYKGRVRGFQPKTFNFAAIKVL